MFVIVEVLDSGSTVKVLDTSDGSVESIRVKDLIDYVTRGILSKDTIKGFAEVGNDKNKKYEVEVGDETTTPQIYVIKQMYGSFTAIKKMQTPTEQSKAVTENTQEATEGVQEAVESVQEVTEGVQGSTDKSQETNDSVCDVTDNSQSASDPVEEVKEDDSAEHEVSNTSEVDTTPTAFEEGITERNNDFTASVSGVSDGTVSAVSQSSSNTSGIADSSGCDISLNGEADTVRTTTSSDISDIENFTGDDISLNSEADAVRAIISSAVETETSNGEVAAEKSNTYPDIEQEDGTEVLKGIIGSVKSDETRGTDIQSNTEDSSVNVESTSVFKETLTETSEELEDGEVLLSSMINSDKKQPKTGASTKGSTKEKTESVKSKPLKTSFTYNDKKYYLYLGAVDMPEGKRRLLTESDLAEFKFFEVFAANENYTYFLCKNKRGKKKGKLVAIGVTNEVWLCGNLNDIAYKDKILKSADKLLNGYIRSYKLDEESSLYRICATSTRETLKYIDGYFEQENADLTFKIAVVVTDDPNVYKSL